MLLKRVDDRKRKLARWYGHVGMDEERVVKRVWESELPNGLCGRRKCKRIEFMKDCMEYGAVGLYG